MGEQILYYGGIVLLVIGGIGSAAAAILFHISGKRLRERLNSEYGNKRH